MGRTSCIVLATVVAFGLVGCHDETGATAVEAVTPRSTTLILHGVTIVDPRTGEHTPDMSVYSKGGRIVRIVPMASVETAPAAQSIDAVGKFLVPGFLDMHTHALGEGDPIASLSLMLVNGITGFRQMQGSADLLARRRDGTLSMPTAGPALLAMPGPIVTPFAAADPASAATTVRAQREAGADFIKIVLASPESFFAVLAEAGRQGIPVAGHVPIDVDVREASDAGMRSIEHLGPANGILVACSSEAGRLLDDAPALPGLLARPPFQIPFADALVRYLLSDVIINPAAQTSADEFARIRRMVDAFSEPECRRTLARFVENGTWQVPTLIRLRSSQLAFEPGFQNDPNLRFVDPSTLESWVRVTAGFEQRLSAADRQTLRDAYALDLELVRLMDAEGVRMLAGSDAVGAGWLVPGFALHREFDELAKAGLSPLRVLQMTTIDGAEFLGRTSTLGSVEVGKDADLVLLDADPIERVENLHRIHGVVRAGVYYSREALDALAATVASRSAQ